jgi:ATP-dependent exoDNAse (exonuclease V) beta subunit
MSELFCRIICASAGTGKTYRLSLEYIALLLQYYGVPGFSTDSILALTFTRKATAEIRDRIVKHIDLLISKGDSSERMGLLENLRKLAPAAEMELSDTERNKLISARFEIACDQSHLQVMTLDSYISNIFRNIVRPLRNIESYEIDTQAITKRMPFLMDHLMKPAFRARLNNLLSRKVSRSLDSYAKFFVSLISQRWLYYMITQRLSPFSGDSSCDQARVRDMSGKTSSDEALAAFKQEFDTLLGLISSVAQEKQAVELGDFFRKKFADLLSGHLHSIAAISQRVESLASDIREAERLLEALSEPIWNKNKIKGQKYQALNDEITVVWKAAERHLADHLMSKLYVSEQQEILELWKLILDEYDRLIYRYKNMTYDDIAWFSFEALFSVEPPFFDPQSEVSASEFYHFLSHRTRFMLIDEFQDTSLIQFNIIKPIIAEISSGEGSKPYGGLIVVGDEKQSIFGWRGGQRDLLLSLQSIFPSLGEVKTERLDSCFRCGPSLMQFVNQLFSSSPIHAYLADKNMNWDYPLIRGARIDREASTSIEFCLKNTSKSMAVQNGYTDAIEDFVKSMVLPALADDPSGNIAILCRKGSELSKVQQVLDESGTASLYQPDRSICDHLLVSPIIDWMRFLAWGSWADFLSFLRSDYVRIGSKTLKQIADCLAVYNGTATPSPCTFSDIPIAENIMALASEHKALSPAAICNGLSIMFLKNRELSERDYLNLHEFINIVTTWENQNSDKGNTLPDLLKYLSENKDSENFKQASIAGSDSLQLLTIHKSKGLEFKRVFVYYNLTSRHSGDHDKLAWALKYAGKDFHYVEDYGISLHYEKVLKASSYRYLWDEEQKRQLLEELNNLYVAFTRAESKLHLYFCYQNKDGWDDYLSKKEAPSLPALLCNSSLDFFIQQGISPDENGIYTFHSPFREEEETLQQMSVPQQIDSNIVSLEGNLLSNLNQSRKGNWNSLIPIEQPKIQNWNKYYLEDRPNLLGDLAHYYLSHIIHNTRKEQDYALRRCLLRFGSIMRQGEIVDVCERCLIACNANGWLFDSQWDKIYTELELEGNQGLLRLDRLMINTSELKAMIVDYKSGDIHDTKQLENYSSALLKLNGMSQYAIEVQFLKI